MSTILHHPPPCTRLSHMAQLHLTARRAAEETGVHVCDAGFYQWLCRRPELISCDEATAILAAEYIGVWLGWRNGGRPPFGYWPSTARRPDLPARLKRSAGTMA